jgi:hypothetical protein
LRKKKDRREEVNCRAGGDSLSADNVITTLLAITDRIRDGRKGQQWNFNDLQTTFYTAQFVKFNLPSFESYVVNFSFDRFKNAIKQITIIDTFKCI